MSTEYPTVDAIHGNYVAESTPDGMRARVCDTFVVGTGPGIRHVIATFEGETAWSDAARMALDLHLAEDPRRSSLCESAAPGCRPESLYKSSVRTLRKGIR